MPPRVSEVIGRDADEAVHARLGLELAVGVMALDLDRAGLDAASSPGCSSSTSALEAILVA